MLRRIKCVCTLSMCLLFGQNRVSAENINVIRSFEARYAEMKRAFSDHDERVMSTMLSPNYESVDVHGNRTGSKELLQQLELPLSGEKKTTETLLLAVQFLGDKTFVTQEYDARIRRLGADGSMRNIELRTVSKDTWISISGKWLLQRTVTQQLDVKVNSILVDHEVNNSSIP